MVYNWDDKEAECYRLYVEERRSLDEVVAYWEQKGFTPRYVVACLGASVACTPSWPSWRIQAGLYGLAS